MDIFSAFALDEKRMTDGIWHVLKLIKGDLVLEPIAEHEIGDQAAVLIASTDNPRYQALIEQKLEPYKQKRKEITRVMTDRVIAECIAELIVLDWRNWELGEQPIGYSREMVLDIWTNPKWALLKEKILIVIGNRDLFKFEREEAIIKN